MSILTKFLLTASFVTCLPVAPKSQSDADSLSGLSKYLPAVGLLVGVILCACYALLKVLNAPSLLAAAALFVVWLLVTGAIHFDGLMDSADGIFSHRSRERMLEIMKDSRVGNFGVLTAICVTLLKCVGLVLVFERSAWPLFLLIPCWARWCETFAIGSFHYAREEGMGKIWHDTTQYPRDIVIAAVIPLALTIAACALAHSAIPVVAAAACIASGLGTAYAINAMLDGQTGDTYGCVVEVSEVSAVFIAALAL